MTDDGKGYKLPEGPDSPFSACITFAVPMNDEYIRAAFGALTELTKWWSWERTEDKRGAQTAQVMRRSILSSFRVTTCPEPSFDTFEFWKWNVRDSMGVWGVSPIVGEGSGETISLYQAGQGFIGLCLEPDYVLMGTALAMQNPPQNIGGELAIEVAGLNYDDRVYVSGQVIEPQTSGGLLPQWVYIGYATLMMDNPVISIISDGCRPNTYPRISALGFRSFTVPYGAQRGVWPF